MTIISIHEAKTRLLVAQARFEPMILLTDHDVLGGYGDFIEVV